MNISAGATLHRTATEMVFYRLYEDILSLKLLPGTRISEAEVANQLGVSRQPVRDAFNRLGNLGLLLIRPQRATEVRGFSMEEIHNARFIRLAVELEVMERGCAVWDDDCAKALDEVLDLQRDALAAGQIDEFHALDYDFHKLICTLSGHPLAFETIERYKRTVDRLCMLSLEETKEASAILRDHEDIARALIEGAVEPARAVTRRHLSRLDSMIDAIRQANAEYFE